MIELEEIMESTDTRYVCKCSDCHELYKSILDDCNRMSSYLNCIDLINVIEQVKTSIIFKHIDKCNNCYTCYN